MLLTTKQAEEKACCVDVRATCASERCMAWRWGRAGKMAVFLRAIPYMLTEEPERPHQVPPEATWEPYDPAVANSPAGWRVKHAEERLGFCGRAGRPDHEI